MNIPITKTIRRRATTVLLAALFGLNARAGEIGHYLGGIPNIRDFAMPAPGFYGSLYNYYYTTDQLNDRNGNKQNSVTINPLGGSGVTLNLKVDVNTYALAPMLVWVSDFKILGARYGAYILPTFADGSIAAALSTERGRGINANTGTLGVGDLFVQPLWLGWSPTNWDFALGYGFWAPVGKYNTEAFTFPGGGTVRTESPDNIGLGFWTQQAQGSGYWYPWADKRMAIGGAVTYEYNQKKKDFDLTPGQNISLNWGISQYLPLKKDQTLLAEVGVAGYDTWQITDDTGSDARDPSVHDQVHAVGGQAGVTYVPWNMVLNFHYFYEYAATDRFQGSVFGITIAKKF